MYKDENKYGIALISGKEFRFYTVTITGEHVDFTLIQKKEGRLQKKQKKGGQSAQRFGRIREEIQLHYVRNVAELMVDAYLDDNNTKCNVESILIGGNGNIKREVMGEDIFKQYFSGMICGLIETTELEPNLVNQVYEQNKHLFSSKKDDPIVSEIFDLIDLASDKLKFGKTEIFECLHNESLKYVLVYKNDSIISEIKKIMPKKCKLVETDSNIIKMYGNMIGLTFY